MMSALALGLRRVALGAARRGATTAAAAAVPPTPPAPAPARPASASAPASAPASASAFEELLQKHFSATGTLAGSAVRLVGTGAGGKAGRELHATLDDEAAVIAALKEGPVPAAAPADPARTADAHAAASAWVRLAPPAGPVLESFSVATLLRANVHLGHSVRAAHRHMLPYVAGERHGVHVIDLEQTQAALRRAVNVVREVAARGGIIVFVGTRPALADVVVAAAGRCAQYHVIHTWVPGTLTNMGETVGRRRRLAPTHMATTTATGGATDARDEEGDAAGAGGLEEDSPSDGALVAQALQATAARPDLLLLFDPMLNDIALREAVRCHVPTIGLADTNADPRRFTYAIPANDDSVLSVAYIASILANAALEGMLAAAQAAQAATKAR
jgi:small subunit ribosomal protein S2